ncbi:hypothetical protein ABCR94_26195 [Streptomyces sp. 21So2-11]|uniref:hypothetical protein n=1 Tax=Streptomyces sp. 21So2-11 TaxID=3144408 RepID=UPI00321C0C69
MTCRREQPPLAAELPAQPPLADTPPTQAPAEAPEPATPEQQGHPDTMYVVPAPAPVFGPAPVPPEVDAQANAQARANAQAQTYVPGLTPTPTPTPIPYTRPAPNPERRKRVLVWTGTLVAAVIIGGGATAGALLLQNKDDGGSDTLKDDKPAVAQSGGLSVQPSNAQTSSPSTPFPSAPSPSSPPPSFNPSPSVTPLSPPGSPEVPSGFRQVADPAGFSFAIPNLWTREKAVNGQITYAGSTGLEHLLVGVVRNPPYASSYDNFVGIEKKSKANQRNYQRLRLEQNTFQGRPGALWEFTFTDKQSGETLHAIDQGYIAENGIDYSIYTKSRDRDWQYARQTFDTALATWTLD